MRALPRVVAVGVAAALLALTAACSNESGAISATEQETSGGAAGGADHGLSAEDQAAIRATLAETADQLGVVDPPQVEIVRVVSIADWPGAQVQCLKDEGFPGAAITADGEGIEVTTPMGAPRDGLNRAMYVCEARYPRDPAQDPTRMTREQQLIVFTYVTETLVGCLADHGYAIVDIPSRETFLASLGDGGVPWNPYDQLAKAETMPAEEVTTACPANTPSELIWGD